MVVIYWFYIWTIKCIISTEGSALLRSAPAFGENVYCLSNTRDTSYLKTYAYIDSSE